MFGGCPYLKIVALSVWLRFQSIKITCYILYLFGCQHHSTQVEINLWDLVLSFYHVNHGTQIQVIGLGGRCHYLPNHLGRPILKLSVEHQFEWNPWDWPFPTYSKSPEMFSSIQGVLLSRFIPSERAQGPAMCFSLEWNNSFTGGSFLEVGANSTCVEIVLLMNARRPKPKRF